MSRRGIATLATLAVVGGAAAAFVASGRLGASMQVLARTNTRLAWLAGMAFLVSLVATAWAWRATFEACGARLSGIDACARYGVGSLANSVLPARLGDGLRLGLFMRTLPEGESRLLVAGGGLGAVTAVRGLLQAGLFAAAAALGALPVWPVVAAAGLAVVVAVAAFGMRSRLRTRRLERLLDAARELVRRPARGARVVSWTGVALLARLAAAAATTSALGVRSPLASALIITAVLDVASVFPITPGNIGITTGAVALALEGRGVALSTAIAVGVVFHAVEAAVGILFGLASVPLVARPQLATRLQLRVALALAAVALVGSTGVTIAGAVT